MRETVIVLDVALGAEAAPDIMASLQAAHPDLAVVSADQSLAAAVNVTWEERRCHVLVVTGEVEVPVGLLDVATELVEHDLRIATVSFLSDGPGLLHVGPPGPQVPEGDADPVTSRLRAGPRVQPATLPHAAGPVVLLSSYARSAIGPLGDGDWEAALVDYSLRGRDRGFLDVVDPSTYCRTVTVGERPAAIGATPFRRAGEVDELRREAGWEGSPLVAARAAAQAKAFSVRVLVDGSCLGPMEMGTQVQTVALVAALARRPEVNEIVLALSSEPPEYARPIVSHEKVSVARIEGPDLSGVGPVDIGHQPFQPDGPLDVESFSDVASRSLVTLLDLIAYHGRSYHLSAESWVAYRRRVQRAAGQADGIVVPSAEVGTHLELERLVPDVDRLFVVELGTDHLTGQEVASAPAAMGEREHGAEPFVLVLGANYPHKNRDVAVRVVRELRRRGGELPVVMAGAPIVDPARAVEAALAREDDGGVVVIPDVTSEERNWLLRQAAVLLYPSSAEGFGFVPFEAARFGTPTVLVPVGPLQWFADLPVVAEDWSVGALADACEQLMADPDIRQAQVDAVMKIGERLTWDAAATKLIDVYRSVLDRPSRATAARIARVPLASALPRPPVPLPSESADAEELARLRADHDELRRAHDRLQQSLAVRAATQASSLRHAVVARARKWSDDRTAR